MCKSSSEKQSVTQGAFAVQIIGHFNMYIIICDGLSGEVFVEVLVFAPLDVRKQVSYGGPTIASPNS